MALAGAGGMSLAFRSAAPRVEGRGLYLDTVQRGALTRSVHGVGRLVPEELRWVTAPAVAQVERVLARPGAEVGVDTVLVELSNPDLALALLETERDLAVARAQLTNLEATAKGQRLEQQGALAQLRAEAVDARRREAADEELARREFLSGMELARSKDRAEALAIRVSFEERRLIAQQQWVRAQAAAQREQIARQVALVEFRRANAEALSVRAGMDGVLQELDLQVGQSVAPGQVLAKVARPDRLKAEVRISELEAKDLAVGLRATVDLRAGVVPGEVLRVDPNVQNGTVRVELSLQGELPSAARPELTVEASIELEQLQDVLFVGRPAGAQTGAEARIFKLTREGAEAQRTSVRFGRGSARVIEVLSGLAEGDRVVLSDTSAWDDWERVRLQ